MFTHNRNEVSLNGTWKFCPDPMQRCRSQKWWINPPKKNESFPCWDEAGLWDIEVPSTWKVQFDELKWYDGHAVYTKTFELDDIPEDTEAFLVFDGVIYSSEVYLNGQFVGKHDRGYSPFSFRVTEILKKHNRLFVLVENLMKEDRVPGQRFDWVNDGGIINPVKLIFVPVTHIENFATSTQLDGDDVFIDVDIMLQSRDISAAEDVTVSIPELGLEDTITVEAGMSETISFQVPRDMIELWSPENPKLYITELSTRFETVTDEIGYREIRTEGTDIMLNGEPIRLYGVSTHSEFKDTGRTATPEGIDLLIARAKELGVNFLRCAHYPYAESWGRALDKAGLMWWEEVPAYWLMNMGDQGQTDLACGMMADTIQRDWNRASLIIWSVSNECCYSEPTNPEENNYAYWFEVVPMVRQMDPSRLISCAESGNMISVKPIWDPQSGDDFSRDVADAESWRPGHPDEIYELFDILSANIYVHKSEFGLAHTFYRTFVNMLKRYNKPLMLSEFGGKSLLGCDLPEGELGGELTHMRVIREAYEAFEKLPELKGYCPWCLMDIRSVIQWKWYNQGKAVFRYGFVDENWEKKKVFDTVAESIAKLKKAVQ